jgi:hypothetical protein
MNCNQLSTIILLVLAFATGAFAQTPRTLIKIDLGDFIERPIKLYDLTPLDVRSATAAQNGLEVKLYTVPLNLHAKFSVEKDYSRRHNVEDGFLFCGWKATVHSLRRGSWNVNSVDQNGLLFEASATGSKSPLNRVSGRVRVDLELRGVRFKQSRKEEDTRLLNCGTDGYSMAAGGANRLPAEVSFSCSGSDMYCTTYSRDSLGNVTESRKKCGVCATTRF